MPDWTPLAAAIARAEAAGAIIGAAVIAPDGTRFSHNGARHFRAASTVKIAIMIELFRQVDAGTHRLDQPHTLAASEKANGSGVLLHLHDGLVLTVADVAYLMMSISDNAATNILIDLVGQDRVNATMRALGMKSSVLGRKMLGRPVPAGDPENWAAPDDYATLVAAILAGTAASPASCAKMVTLLEQQQNPRRIARHLPEGTRWGSKTGSLSGVVNDVGFIDTKAGPICLALFCENPPDAHAGEAFLGDLARSALAGVQGRAG